MRRGYVNGEMELAVFRRIEAASERCIRASQELVSEIAKPPGARSSNDSRNRISQELPSLPHTDCTPPFELVANLNNCFDGRRELLPEIGQRILDGRRRGGHDPANQDAGLL